MNGPGQWGGSPPTAPPGLAASPAGQRQAERPSTHTALVRRVLFPERRRMLAAKIDTHARLTSRAEIEAFQVRRFNHVWAHCLATVPFYRSWSREHGLPDRISSPDDLSAFPALDKQTFLNRSDEIFQHGAITAEYLSGGSTGVSARYPRGPDDDKIFYANTYLGRSWSGIAPFDPTIHIWTHDHLFGAGATRVVRKTRRRVADRVVGISRRSCYTLTGEAFHAHYLRIRRDDAVYVMGYPLGMTQLARYIEQNELPLGQLRMLRAVVLSAETVTASDIAVIERVFRVPCVIEYGSGETGVMAASRGSTLPLHVFWDSFICLSDPKGALKVTTLDTRLFPLVNYEIGDRVDVEPGDPMNLLTLRNVVGRLKDLVCVAVDGKSVALSCRLPVHILKTHPDIVAYQFDQQSPTHLHVLLQGHKTLDLLAVARYFASELHRNHYAVDPESVTFEQVPSVVMTLAGKHTPFVPQSAPQRSPR